MRRNRPTRSECSDPCSVAFEHCFPIGCPPVTEEDVQHIRLTGSESRIPNYVFNSTRCELRLQQHPVQRRPTARRRVCDGLRRSQSQQSQPADPAHASTSQLRKNEATCLALGGDLLLALYLCMFGTFFVEGAVFCTSIGKPLYSLSVHLGNLMFSLCFHSKNLCLLFILS